MPHVSPMVWYPKMRLDRSQRMFLLVTLLVGGYLIVVLGFQRWVLFPRYAVTPDRHPGAGVPGLVRWTRETDGAEIEAWLLPGKGVSAESPGPAVLFAHGNGELIEHWPETLAAYRQMGVTVLLPEYRGYGRSSGSPGERVITSDFVYFHDRLAALPEVDESRIVFHGRSLGGGAVCALARERPPRALVLMSTFTSIADMARRYFLPRFLVLDPFDNEDTLRTLDVPVLLVHGSRDKLIPVTHGQRLAEVSPRARLVLYEADHNDCPPDWEPFWDEVRTFLEENQIL